MAIQKGEDLQKRVMQATWRDVYIQISVKVKIERF